MKNITISSTKYEKGLLLSQALFAGTMVVLWCWAFMILFVSQRYENGVVMSLILVASFVADMLVYIMEKLNERKTDILG
jgi:hypothetical protein